MAIRGAMTIGAYLFFGGFFFSRFGAFLFPMDTVSHIRVRLASSWIKSAFDASLQRTLE
jgi:hypothetical protein